MAVVLIRATILYIIITFSLRLMGKRQLGELQPSELVVTILISNIAAIPVEDSSVPMILGIVPIFTLVCLDVIDLVEAMREEQIFDITEIWYAIVETTGKIHFLKKKDCQNAEKADVNCGGSSSDPPAVIIRDGREDEEQLQSMGLGMGWLKEQLRERKLSVKDVFLMTADRNGQHTIIERQRGL